MPLKPPDPRTIGMNRQLVDLESQMLTMQQGGMCNVVPGSIERIEATLDLILREINEIKATLLEMAKNQNPQKPEKPPTKKKRVKFA